MFVLSPFVTKGGTNGQRHVGSDESQLKLKAVISQLQEELLETKDRLALLQKEFDGAKLRFREQQEQWRAFQEDLLTTVRVANEFKTEAQETVERLTLKNKKLSERIPQLEAEIARLKAITEEKENNVNKISVPSHNDPNKTHQPPVHPPQYLPVQVPQSPLRTSGQPAPPVTPRRSVSVSPLCVTSPPIPSPMRSISVEPVPSPQIVPVRKDPLNRKSIAKWVDFRQASQLSVKNLILSLENKQQTKSQQNNNSNNQSEETNQTSPKSPVINCNPFITKITVTDNTKSVHEDLSKSTPTKIEVIPTHVIEPKNDGNQISVPITKRFRLKPFKRSAYMCTDIMSEKMKDDPLADLKIETGGGSKRNALLKVCFLLSRDT